VYVGYLSGQNTTSLQNTFVGSGSGYLVTSGQKNTIIGTYSGNQGGLDIRTSSNNIVLSDGDGNPRIVGRVSITVSTSAVQLAQTMGIGGAYIVSAFNTSGGAQGVWWVLTRGSVATVVSSSNGTGLTVTFTSTNYGTLNMATSSGTLSVNVTALG
jgi:hypothetical protein